MSNLGVDARAPEYNHGSANMFFGTQRHGLKV